jgi:ABC-type dipeptide/oligopeptide/nickel transport system permease subunit
MKRFLTTKGLIGIVLLLIIAAVAIIGPMVIPPDAATAMDMTARRAPPSMRHLFGTDQLGRDMMFRVILGARTSLEIAVSAVVMSIALGLPLGLISGYFGGFVDNVLMRLVDTLLAFPALLLALTKYPEHHHRHWGCLYPLSCPHHSGRGAQGRPDALCRGRTCLGHHRWHDHDPPRSA